MHTNGYQRVSWGGLLTVAAGLLGQQGHAANWCPTAIDYQITCSNCSRELTCDVNGISIEILGNNVTLDGNGYSISNAPYDGITVSPSTGAADAKIKNLNIYDAAQTGIYYSGGVSYSWGMVENVFISGSYFSGIQHSSWNPVEIKNSWTYNNQDGVIGSYASSTAYTDFLHSSAQGNSTDGYFAGSSSGSWVKNSYFWNNGSTGANISYAGNILVDSSSFSTSTATGLHIYSSDGTTITNNYGGLNSNYDCIHDGFSSTYASNNTWNTYSGSGCLY